MSVTLITILLFASLVILLVSGLPLAFCMGGLAALFTIIIMGPQALSMTAYVTYGVMDNFILLAIPLFIFMGAILERSGIAEDAFEMIYKWIGHVRGGLAMGTIVICTIFAAVTGVSAAATVAMGVIALPAMLKRHYDKSIAVGSIAAGGALGILIPPSVLMIVYGVFASESIGKLFAGGVLPGLLLAFMFIAYIGIRSIIQPNLCPPIPVNERPTWKERFLSLRGVILPGLLVLVILGSILGGICTPTEAAGIGSIGSLICAAVHRRLNWNLIREACHITQRLSCMIGWVIIGGMCFSAIYTAGGALEFIKTTISALPVSPYIVLVGMQISLLFLGMILDPGAIIMITTPIYVPIIKSFGFDPVWFGVIFIVNMEMAYLTPPFGFNLFYMKSIVPDGISMGDIYRSVLPFVIIQAICMVILVMFPQIVLWLPSMLF